MMSSIEDGVLTQSQKSEKAYNYVIKNLFRQDLDGPISSSLLVYTGNMPDIMQVLEMGDEDIDDLYYFKSSISTPQDEEEETKKLTKPKTITIRYELPKGSKRLVKVLKSFNRWMTDAGEAIYFDWSNIDPKDFDDYRLAIYNADTKVPMPSRFSTPSVNNNTPPSVYTNNTNLTMAQQFRKSIKRDPSTFGVLKTGRQFKNWHRTLLATAAAQDVSEILDSNYTPISPDEIELFKEKQKYMYQVADRILQTDRGIVFVGQHETDFDAQKVFAKTLSHYLMSRTADIDASQYLTYITTAKFNPSTWNGTAIGFISNWQEQVRN